MRERALLRLVEAARDTEFVLARGFHGIRSVADSPARVPLGESLDFRLLRTGLRRSG